MIRHESESPENCPQCGSLFNRSRVRPRLHATTVHCRVWQVWLAQSGNTRERRLKPPAVAVLANLSVSVGRLALCSPTLTKQGFTNPPQIQLSFAICLPKTGQNVSARCSNKTSLPSCRQINMVVVCSTQRSASADMTIFRA